MRHKLRIGVWPCKAPIGYINDSRTKTIQLDSERSIIVKKAFGMFAEGKRSFTEIALYFHKFGISSMSNKPLKADGIKRIFANRFYIGIMQYGKEYYQGTHKTFIPKKLFDEVQKQVVRIERPRFKGHNFAFSGLARCGECNAAITAESHTKKYKNGTNQTFIYYRCTKKLKPCSQKYMPEEKMEEQLREIIKRVALPEEWAKDWYK